MNPFVVIGKKLEVSGYITNTGSETFSNPELTVNIDGTDYTARLKDVSVASGERVPFTQTLRYTPWETGLSNYTLTLESGDLEASASGSFRRVNHKIVVEEGTGVWCGYCVRGIASFEHCEQLFPDNFIPIAIHGGNDPMKLDDYSFETICTCPGYPAATVNRSGFFDIAPTRLASEITSRLQTPPAAALDLEMTVTGSSASVDAEIFFPSFYSNADYRMAAFLKEDGICHPDDFSYNQSNGYAGGADGSMGGFENLPNPILCKDITYNDVCRAALTDPMGEINSLPSSMKVGESAKWHLDFTLPANVEKPENTSLVVMVLDHKSGEVLAGEEIPFRTGDSAVSDLTAESSLDISVAADRISAPGAALQVFDLTGRMIASGTDSLAVSASGLMIVKATRGAETRVSKIFIR